jgi:Tol biopolymer transport system component
MSFNRQEILMNNKFFRAMALIFCLLPTCGAPALIANGDPVDYEFLASAQAYRGLPVPNMVARVFISSAEFESGLIHNALAISPDGREIFWSVITNGQNPAFSIRFTRYENGAWTAPQVASFSGVQEDTNPFFSLDGQRLYYCQEGGANGSELMAVERRGDGWSTPFSMGPTFYGIHYQGSISGDGTIYFPFDVASDRRDIFKAPCIDGQYPVRELLPAMINSNFDDSGPFIAPDESYLLFSSNRPGGYGVKDIYISCRLPNGDWTTPENMGYLINSGHFESWVSLSPDGRYLFFQSSGQQSDVYWIKAQVIDYLKTRILNAWH